MSFVNQPPANNTRGRSAGETVDKSGESATVGQNTMDELASALVGHWTPARLLDELARLQEIVRLRTRTSWMITKEWAAGRPSYWGGEAWVDNPNYALWLSRKDDAERLCRMGSLAGVAGLVVKAVATEDV